MAERSPLALALAAGALVAACYGPNPPLGAPCDKETDCPEGQSCDPETSTCGPPSGFTTWLDDEVEHFAASGAGTSEAAVEPGGFVGPVGYFRGGVRISGIESIAIPNPATPWNEIAALARTGAAFVRAAEISGQPPGTGLMQSDGITLVIEGEIHLDRIGTWTFELNTDELGFIDLSPPDGSLFQRVVTTTSGKLTGRYDVAVKGWHRFRGAIIDKTGDVTYAVKHGSPGGGNPSGIDVNALRAPASDLQGLFIDGFDDPFLIRPSNTTTVDALPLDKRVFDNDKPSGLPLGSNNKYSLRFASQVLIDVGGKYELQIESEYGHRAWIDGQLVGDLWDTPTGDPVSRTGEILLDPGWHDLVVDLNRDGTDSAELDVKVVSGPAWVGLPIPVDHMRPIVPRAARWVGDSSAFTTVPNIPDAAAGTRTATFDIPGDMMVSRIDAAFQVTHNALGTVDVKMDPPPLGIGPQQIIPLGTINGAGAHYRHFTMGANTAASGSWIATATDNSLDSVGGTLNFAAVTVQGSYGDPPYASSYSYTSAPREIGNVESFAYVRWALRQERPETAVTVSLRTCDTAAACEGEPWTAVARGAVPELTPRRFAQYRVELAGTGDVPTALDWIEIAYRSADKQ